MTRRTLNFTGRKTIAQKYVKVNVDACGDLSVTWDLAEYAFHESARIYIEAVATSSGSPIVLRFPYGTVSAPMPPDLRSVGAILGGNIGFTLKVVDESVERGRLLGVAANIRAVGSDEEDDDAHQQPLLPVLPTPLGALVWQITYAHDRPWLEVNNGIPNIMERIRSDTFFALVYPAVIREVLFQILMVDEYAEVDSNAHDWRTQWLRWGVHWHPEKERPVEGIAEDVSSEWVEWIDAVVNGFANHHATATKYANGEESLQS